MLPLRVILDPSALAVSRIGDNKEEALQYIDALVSWDFFRSAPLSSLIISRDSLNALFVDNEYLDQKKLSLKLKQCNVYEHSANDLIQYFHKLTSLHSYLEDENVQITDKEVKIDSVTPAIPENAIGTNLQALFIKTLQCLILEAEQPNERQSILAQRIIKSTVIDTTSSLNSHDLNPHSISKSIMNSLSKAKQRLNVLLVYHVPSSLTKPPNGLQEHPSCRRLHFRKLSREVRPTSARLD